MAENTAFVIIDTQMAFFEAPKPLYQADTLIANIKSLIAKARAAQVPVIYVQQNASGDLAWMNDTPLKNIHPGIAPQESDLVIQKWEPDIFAEAALPAELDARGIKKLVLAGLQTEYCINNSCRSGAARGYDITLVGDAHSTFDSDTMTAPQIIERYTNELRNVVRVMPTQDIAFAEADSQAEILDIYDENLMKLGSKIRADVHRDGDWHRVFQCWIAYEQQGEAYLVMQRRAPNKQFYPNLLDTTSAGHYAVGETIQDGIREIREELGIDVTFDQLVPIGRRVSVTRNGDLIDHEVADVFLLIYSKNIREYRMQIEEVSGLVAFKVSDALELFTGKRQTIPAQAVGYATEWAELRTSDFIPTLDHLMEKILVLVQRYFREETTLFI
ncbi:MAG TPA: isochorismatase family protein [Aggregatilineales bacterium]|nr:isochorismatase family protein [Aggregatilineales bacterium]